jgi:hypothetical protein
LQIWQKPHTLCQNTTKTRREIKKHSQSNKEGCFSLVVWCIVIDTKRSTRRRRWWWVGSNPLKFCEQERKQKSMRNQRERKREREREKKKKKRNEWKKEWNTLWVMGMSSVKLYEFCLSVFSLVQLLLLLLLLLLPSSSFFCFFFCAV